MKITIDRRELENMLCLMERHDRNAATEETDMVTDMLKQMLNRNPKSIFDDANSEISTLIDITNSIRHAARRVEQIRLEKEKNFRAYNTTQWSDDENIS